MRRHHVHLSSDKETAKVVTNGRGKAVIFEVEAEQMFNDGYEFYKSENDVWLTDYMSVDYIRNRKKILGK